MKRIIILCLTAVLMFGCSTSDPEISDVTISDTNPVTGQKTMLQIYASTDNPPFKYNWTCDGGVFDESNSDEYWAYWTSPDEPGAYSITCTVTDDEDRVTDYTFSVDVTARQVETGLIDADEEALCMDKQTVSTVGGIWVSIKGKSIRYFSSSTIEDTSWDHDFNTFYLDLDESFQSYLVWGAYDHSRDITVISSSDSMTVTCQTCLSHEMINDFSIDMINPDKLWIGANSGLHYYDKSSNTGDTYKNVHVYDLSNGPVYTYAATDSGLYALGSSEDPIYEGSTCHAYIDGDEESIVIWTITEGLVCKDGQPLSSQPDEIVCSLDMDSKGNIWNGKYWWDGTSWQSPDGLEDITIVESQVSNEGLVYMRSDSGTLFSW